MANKKAAPNPAKTRAKRSRVERSANAGDGSPSAPGPSLSVVAIGDEHGGCCPANTPYRVMNASAGGLASFTELLNALPSKTGMAFALIQHLEPRHASALAGQPLEILVPQEARERHAEHHSTLSASMQSRPMGAGLDLDGRRKAGSIFPVEISLSLVETASGKLRVAYVSDITQRVQLEKAPRARAMEVQALAARLMTVEEEEPSRVSRELHNQICQTLASLAMDVGELAAILRLPEEAQPRLEFSDEVLPAPVPRDLYRVSQECLENIAKHSGTEHVSVALTFHKGTAVLAIADDGVGFNLDEAKRRGALGLITPRRATQVSIAVPLPANS